MTSPDLLDVAVIGGGIGGVACLGYARRAGLSCRAFERQPAIGGLWRQLPAWQDIRIGIADWALGPLQLASTYQLDIEAMIRACPPPRLRRLHPGHAVTPGRPYVRHRGKRRRIVERTASAWHGRACARVADRAARRSA